MNFKNKTLWMGNIETWMTRAYISSFLNKINIFPIKITLKSGLNKRGCAFLEFLSREKAEEIMNNYNGKTINNFELKFNWVKTSEEKLLSSQGKKYKVKINFIYNIIYLQLFIGNIDKSIKEEELKKFFYEKYNSIISFKLMINQETNKSKGYAFIEFADNKEFQTALNNTEPIIFGKQKLVFNLAKNRYEPNQSIFEYKENLRKYNNNNIENYIKDLTYNNIKISGKLDGNTNNCSINSNVSLVEGINRIKQEKDLSFNSEINNKSIHEQIKYALKKMANLYSNTNPYFFQSKLCSYYCGPFLERDIFESNHEAFQYK